MSLFDKPKSNQRRSVRLSRGTERETGELRIGLDFRRPEYRREVFLRFYEFHLENRAHPGCVYYAMPWLVAEHKLDGEQKLWLAFINGNTQNIVTSWEIFKRFPNLASSATLKSWFDANYQKLAWDTDRRYHKKDFVRSVEVYRDLVGSSQHRYFAGLSGEPGSPEYFWSLWRTLREDFHTFGRLSSFSYSEYLRIMGIEVECPTLFLRDLSGSRSHRNGLAKVLGRDDLDWFRETDFEGDYTQSEFEWLEKEAAALLEEAVVRTKLNPRVSHRDVGYFTLESALCTYKSWHRKNRRYANCYQDMFHDRIKLAERNWGASEVKQFWDCREDTQPKHLRLECCPNDPGLVPEKQNWYRNTGQVIMMSKRWPEFDNPFDRGVWGA